MPRILQRLTLPQTDSPADTRLYARLFDQAYYIAGERGIRLFRPGALVLDTYFNSFSAGKWMRHTALRSAVLRVETRGELVLRLIENVPARPARVLRERVVRSEQPSRVELELPFARLAGGSVFLSVSCLSAEGFVGEACYATDAAPLRDVRLGIVITTFNRPDYLAGNLARLHAVAREDPDFAQTCHVVVVDNAANLDLESSDLVTYLKNENLGGAGGFSRGLHHLRRRGGFTHVLFMDDDISLEVESIRRAMALAAFATDPQTCVAGAMFLESEPNVQYEAGASLRVQRPNDAIRKHGAGLDMRDPSTVTKNDAKDYPVDYGAWWFFLFPIALSGSDLAFPLFLRGDDIVFGRRYAKRILTMNGVGVWHLPFEYKDSATLIYYVQRNLEAVRAVATCERIATGATLLHLARAVLLESLTYRYTSAAYRIRAFRDFLAGPERWDSLDAAALNRELRAGDDEKPGALPAELLREACDYYSDGGYRPRLARRAVQILTLNGHLVPSVLLRSRRDGRMRTVPFHSRPLSAVFGQHEVVFRFEATAEGFVARHSKRRFFKNLADLLAVAVQALGRYQRVRREYRDAYPRMVSEATWERRFARAPGYAGATAPANDPAMADAPRADAVMASGLPSALRT